MENWKIVVESRNSFVLRSDWIEINYFSFRLKVKKKNRRKKRENCSASKFSDEMNHGQLFVFISLCFSLVESKIDAIKKTSDVLNDEKRVFDTNFGNNKNYAIDDCIPLAFGDFNADKIVDIFCRNSKGSTNFVFSPCRFSEVFLSGTSLRIMLNDDRSPTTKEQFRWNLTFVLSENSSTKFIFIRKFQKRNHFRRHRGWLWRRQ